MWPQGRFLRRPGEHREGRAQGEGDRGNLHRLARMRHGIAGEEEQQHLRHGHRHRQRLHFAHRGRQRADREEDRSEQQIAHREVGHAQQHEHRPSDSGGGEVGEIDNAAERVRIRERDHRADDRAPQPYPDDRDTEHGEQLAHEHRVHRDCRGEDFDDLVGLLLDQVRQDHAGEEHDQQEQQRLAGLRGANPREFLTGPAGRDLDRDDVRIEARRLLQRYAGEQRHVAAKGGEQAGWSGQHRRFRRAGDHRRNVALLARQVSFGIEGFAGGEPLQHAQWRHGVTQHRLDLAMRLEHRIHVR